MCEMTEQFVRARVAATPIIAISTPDMNATMGAILGAVVRARAKADTDIDKEELRELIQKLPYPVIQWDLVRGMIAKNESGKQALARYSDPETSGSDPTCGNPVNLLKICLALPEDTIVFMCMANRQITSGQDHDKAVLQALYTVRDFYTSKRRTLVLLGASFDLPPEVRGDIVLIDEPYPDRKRLKQIVESLTTAHVRHPLELDDDTVDRAVEAVQGLPAFQAEQVTAMARRNGTLHVDDMWGFKRKQIEQQEGLSVYNSGETFADIGGVAGIKEYLRRVVIEGRNRPGAIVAIDEIEKHLSSSESDTSGVSQDQLATILTYMQDMECNGMILIGPPGSGKSLMSKAIGNEIGIPTVQLDLGAAKGSLVGQSEHQMRDALKVVTAVSNRNSFWIGTCNGITDLKPELRRRFGLGTFFFDLPTREERNVIWKYYLKKYDLGTWKKFCYGPHPSCDGWTGAEIRQCCFTPDHKLLGDDLKWYPAGEYSVGDVVLGFDENGPYRSYRPAVIEMISFDQQPVFEVELESGKTFRLTADHKVLRAYKISRRRGQQTWKRVDQLDMDDCLPHVLPVWDESLTKDAGWLAGMLDGEGSYSHQNGILFGQRPGIVLSRFERLCRQFGWSYSKRQTNEGRGDCQTIRFDGGLGQRLKILGILRPERLIEKVRYEEFGRMESRIGHDRIVRIAAAGKREIAKVTTSTGTLILDGYPHHNCNVAWMGRMSLVEAARYIVPVSVSAANSILRLQRQANNRFLSASTGELYQFSNPSKLAELDDMPADRMMDLA